MSAQEGVIRVLENCGAYVDDASCFPEQFKRGVVSRDRARYRKAITTIAELIAADKEYDEANVVWGGEWYEVDSYGVDGSDFLVCCCCGNESGAGVLNKGVEHEPDCQVGRLEAATARRASALAAVGGSK